MAMFLSSILSDLTSRSMSFLMDTCSRQISQPTVEETLDSLQRLLLRIHILVDEAEERQISNQAMLRQLCQLRKEMYRGYHTLDTFRCREAADEENQNRVSRSFITSIFSSAKRIRFCSDSSSTEQEQLKQVVVCLERIIRDTSELVVFLSGCPRRCRQPYSMYLFLDKCMFGRQMEMERIMDFLFQQEAPIDGNPGVLSIFGPKKVGKSTLIEHACNDERVRGHFSEIKCYRQSGKKDERIVATLSDCNVIKHRSRSLDIREDRTLVIIELVGDIEEVVWMNLYSDCRRHIASGSKIIVASRSDKIAGFGTTQPLKVQFFTPEVYWYFFKVRTFGSTDTRDFPKLASIAMDLAQEMNRSFFRASIYSGQLKANFDACFWSMTLARVKRFKQINPLLYVDKSGDFWHSNESAYVRRVNKTPCEHFVIHHDYETGFVQDTAQNEGPEMSVRDLFFGNNVFRPCGRFKVVVWRSHIPPHYSYMWDCEMPRPQRMVPRTRRKRIQHTQS